MAGRGAAPAGRFTQDRHSGGVGAPPGTTTGPCQELTDRPEPIAGQRKAGPDVAMTPPVARRKAPAASSPGRGNLKFAPLGAPPLTP